MSNITRLQEIAVAVRSHLEAIQVNAMAAGKLLKEAHAELKEQGKSQADFIAFCKEEFGIGKAQAYKLMTIFEIFGEDARFKGVAMSVMYALKDASKDILERAAEYASTNSLNMAIARELLEPTPIKPPITDATGNDSQTEEVSEEAKAKLEEIQATLDAQAIETEKAIAEQAKDIKEQDLIAVQELKASIDSQSETIRTLTEQLAAAQETIKQLTVPTRAKAAAPSLPQFKSKCPYAVLGLSEEESKQVTKIKKAFRELIKCGYGEGHEDFMTLTTAKDALLNALSND